MRRLALSLGLVLACAACAPTPSTGPRIVADLPGPTVPTMLVRVHKGARRLEVWSGDRLSWRVEDIQLGRVPIGPKRFEGDGRTPEGRYRIDWRNPHSAFHLSLHVSYPDARQSAWAAQQGRSAGSMIMIHGQPNGAEERVPGDWTDGCVALSDPQIETLWGLVADGTPIEILP